MFTWNEKNIQWFIDSSKYSLFHEKLARVIKTEIEKNSSLIDVGAGLGCLDRALSDFFTEITLIEPNIDAYKFLLKNKKNNFNIFNNQYEDYLKKNYKKSDYLLLSFFSKMEKEDNYNELSKLCNKKIIYIRNEGHSNNKQLIEYLEKKQIGFTFKRLQLDFSQPLKSSEIDEFINTYYQSKSNQEKINLKKRVQKKEGYYLFKNIKKISIFIIDKK